MYKVLLSEFAPYSICKELYCKLDILITKVVKAFLKFEYYKYGSSPELVLILSRPCSTVTATVESILILVEDHDLHADLAVLIRDPFPLRDGNARFRGPLHLCRQILRFLLLKHYFLSLKFEIILKKRCYRLFGFAQKRCAKRWRWISQLKGIFVCCRRDFLTSEKNCWNVALLTFWSSQNACWVHC